MLNIKKARSNKQALSFHAIKKLLRFLSGFLLRLIASAVASFRSHKKGREANRGLFLCKSSACLFLVAHEHQQELEHVQKIQIKI